MGAFGCAAEHSASALEILAPALEATGEVPTTAAIVVTFDRYLAADTDWDRLATLRSGDVERPTFVAYDPVGKALVVQPALALRPGLGYTLTLDATRLRGIDGTQLETDPVYEFIARAGAPRPPSAWVGFEDVAPILEHKCGCHGPQQGVFPLLTPESLVGVPSGRAPQRMLVSPGQAMDSELVLRILSDYPGILGQQMPPVDEQTPDLTDAERRLIISWVEGL